MGDIFGIERLNDYLYRIRWSELVGELKSIVELSKDCLIYHNGIFDLKGDEHKLYLFEGKFIYVFHVEIENDFGVSVLSVSDLTGLKLGLDVKKRLFMDFKLDGSEYRLSEKEDNVFNEKMKYNTQIRKIFKHLTGNI